jgi:hypothetical protein
MPCPTHRFFRRSSGAIDRTFIDVTQKVSADPAAWALFRKSLPNRRRALANRDGYVLLIGWQSLPENHSKYAERQAAGKLRESVKRYPSEIGHVPVGIFVSSPIKLRRRRIPTC